MGHCAQTLLGSRELEYEAILGADLEPNAATGNTAWPKVWQAIEAGKLTLVNQVRPAPGCPPACLVAAAVFRQLSSLKAAARR